MAGNARWKVKPKGVETVKKGGWYVKKPAAAGGGTTTPRTGTPAGGTPAAQKRSQLAPAPWVGSAGMVGPYNVTPRLDPTRYEAMKSPDTGKWWARPRTELTGLGVQEQADIRGFDTQTTQQGDRIRQAYEQLGQQAEASQAAGSASLVGLTGLIGAGQNPADATAKVLASAAQGGMAATVAPVIGDLARSPTIARAGGLTNLEQFMATRLGDRASTIKDYRDINAQSLAKRDELNATLRGQDLTQLGKIAQNKTTVQTANIRADTATQDRLAGLQKEAARLQNALTIAQGNNQTSRANNIRNNIAKNKALIAKEKGKKATPESIRAWAKRAREMWDGLPHTYVDDQGKKQTEILGYSKAEIIRELIAMGAPRARASAIATQITTAGLSPETAAGIPGMFSF